MYCGGKIDLNTTMLFYLFILLAWWYTAATSFWFKLQLDWKSASQTLISLMKTLYSAVYYFSQLKSGGSGVNIISAITDDAERVFQEAIEQVRFFSH